MKRVGIALLWTLALVLAFVLILPGVTLKPSNYSRASWARSQIATFMTVLETYRSDVGSFPTEEHGLEALWTDPGVRGWNGPYLSKDVPLDPWGTPYRYSVIGGRPHVSSSGGQKPINSGQIPTLAVPEIHS